MGGRWGETLFVYLPSGKEKGCEELGKAWELLCRSIPIKI